MRPSRRPARLRAPLLGALVLVPMLLTSAVAVADQDSGASGDTVVGELVQAWAEPRGVAQADGDLYAAPLSWIETDDGDAVRVPTDQVDGLPVGATVQVQVGREVVDEAVRETGMEAARQVLDAEVVAPAPTAEAEVSTAPATTPLTNEVTVVMVVPAGGSQDATTLAQVVDAVNGPVAAFWNQQSQGAIRLGVTATHDWMTTTATCADPTALWNEAAAAAGFTSGPGKHLLVYVTSAPANTSGCSYGLGQVGTGPGSGGRAYVRDSITSVIAHELGHNFGLGHSSGSQCDGAVEGGSCRTVAYRDYYDVMGVSWEQVGSLNAAQADLLGVLPSNQTATVRASDGGTIVTLAPISGQSGVRGARLVDSRGVQYWVEYRPPAGQDLWLGSDATNRFRLPSGVLIHRRAPSPDTSLLLDATPSASASWDSDWQAVLPVGRSVRLGSGDFTVSVQYADGTAAGVQVSTGSDATLARTPTYLARTAANGTVYVISGSTKYVVADLATLYALAPLGPVQFVSQSYLNQRLTAGPMSRVVLGPNGTMYFVDAGIKLPFTSCALVADYGGSCASPVRLEQRLIDALYSGPPITPMYQTTSGKTFYVTGGTKREVVDATAQVAAGLPTAAVQLLETGLAGLPYGPPVTRDGVVLKNRQTGAATVSLGGQFTTISEGVRAGTAVSALPVRYLDRQSLAFLPAADAEGALVSEAPGGRAFLLTEQGRKEVVDPAMLPATVPVLPAPVLALFPDAGPLAPGTFLKGSRDGSVYVLRGGELRGIGAWADLIALNGGDPAPHILAIDQRVADVLPRGARQLGPGSLVVSPGSATVYFVDGPGDLIPVASFQVTTELGARGFLRVADRDVAAYTVQPGVISSAVDCAGVTYLGLGGALHRVGTDVAADYAPLSPTALDPTACAALAKGGDLTRFLRGNDGSIYSVEGGRKRPITSYATYLSLGGTTANTQPASAFALAQIPTGALL